MSEAAGQFTIDPDWRALDGPVFGLTQSAIVATPRVQLAGGFDFGPPGPAMGAWLKRHVPPTSGKKPMTHSGMARRDRSVTTRWRACMDIPMPPPIVKPSMSAT